MSRLQRLTTWLTAATVAIGSLGVPTSSWRTRLSGELFPCQNCACSCFDAETCWRDCCCYTNSEKLVWAEKNGVKVPIFVVAAARRGQASGSAKRACCSDHADSANCEQLACSESTEPNGDSNCCENKPRASSESADKIVLLMSALKCRGVSVSIGLLPPSIPPAAEALDLACVDLGPLPLATVGNYLSPCHDVATPPPDACERFAI